MRGKVPPLLASQPHRWIEPAAIDSGSLLFLFLTVVGAIASGERWIRRTQYEPPVGRAGRLLSDRGSAAHLWLR